MEMIPNQQAADRTLEPVQNLLMVFRSGKEASTGAGARRSLFLVKNAKVSQT